MSVIEVNDRNFIPEVQCSEVPVLLDFFGTWCVPCQRFAPTVEELAERMQTTSEEIKGMMKLAVDALRVVE